MVKKTTLFPQRAPPCRLLGSADTYYMYVCTYVYIYIYAYTHIVIYIYIFLSIYLSLCVYLFIYLLFFIYTCGHQRDCSVLEPNLGKLCQCASIQSIFRHLWQEKQPSSKMFQSLWLCGMCCSTLCTGARLGKRLGERLGEWEGGRHGCAPALGRFWRDLDGFLGLCLLGRWAFLRRCLRAGNRMLKLQEVQQNLTE